MASSNAQITQLLERWKAGDRSAENDLISAVYPMLRGLAANHIKQHGDHFTLGATDLANETYIRLQAQQEVDWQNREHFFAIAATVVRRVVVDYLRERFADKRGGHSVVISIAAADENELGELGNAVDWIAIDQALNKLESLDAETARVVELKIFSILSAEQIAEFCQTSTATIGRQWRFAKSWLAKELDTPYLNDLS